MSTAKDEVRRLLDELPEDVSLEDIRSPSTCGRRSRTACGKWRRGEPCTRKMSKRPHGPMARRVIWNEIAVYDLDEAAEYIARDLLRYAAVFVREIRKLPGRLPIRGTWSHGAGVRRIRSAGTHRWKLPPRVSRLDPARGISGDHPRSPRLTRPLGARRPPGRAGMRINGAANFDEKLGHVRRIA